MRPASKGSFFKTAYESGKTLQVEGTAQTRCRFNKQDVFER